MRRRVCCPALPTSDDSPDLSNVGARCTLNRAPDKAVQQRGEQFRIMRDDVFDTDRAASQAVGRLQLAGISGPRLAAFEEAAARVSTPDQIAALERQYKP